MDNLSIRLAYKYHIFFKILEISHSFLLFVDKERMRKFVNVFIILSLVTSGRIGYKNYLKMATLELPPTVILKLIKFKKIYHKFINSTEEIKNIFIFYFWPNKKFDAFQNNRSIIILILFLEKMSTYKFQDYLVYEHQCSLIDRQTVQNTYLYLPY